MKVIVYSTAGKKISGRIKSFNIERLLIIIFAVSFLLLVIIQAALTNSDVRAVISAYPESEGVPLEDEVFLFDKGTITLKLCNSDYDPAVVILVNGAEVAAFKENPLNIDVKDGDIIEVDGSAASYKAEIEVLSASDNVDASCIGRRTVTNSNVRKLLGVRFK